MLQQIGNIYMVVIETYQYEHFKIIMCSVTQFKDTFSDLNDLFSALNKLFL